MEKIKYLCVYFDGSLNAFSTLFWAQEQPFRIWITMPEHIDSLLKTYVYGICDCNGTLNHFEDKKCVWHINYGYPEQCIHRLDTEFYFKKLADLSENTQEEVTSLTKICYQHIDGEPCLKCSDCTHATHIAEMYGFYDFVQQTR